ncbi:ABC transporter permease [Nocardioides nematodiphilus]|uniref:ABC transporter permease n=1 Tax=Nocardioides nematodiphilus TaxID=2849669 RepID=UPI001CD9FCE9|nr:ABC transporter permease [Nocardioides nematodiphilus]MCA1983556.1 ABC transporter permease [Nocardioides nematodiphilus]
MSTTAPVEDLTVDHEVVDTTLSSRSRILRAIAYAVLGLISLVWLGTAVDGGTAHLVFDGHTVGLPAKATVIVVGIVILAIAAWQGVRGFGRRATPWAAGIAFLLFMVAFFSWVSTQGTNPAIDVVGLLQNSIALSVPLILGALAGVMCERSGVINVAIEGQMLAGAWAAALVGSVAVTWVGLFGALAAGAFMGVLLALFSIRYLVNQVVLGVVLNVLAAGLTGFLFDAFMANDSEKFNQPGVLGEIDIPLLHSIPIIGPLFFEANIVVYLTYILIFGVDVALFRTRWGLRTRAIGEHPKAADTVGIKVLALRYRNVLIGSAIAGLGGAYFTIGSVGGFAKGITSGNGFIALAAVIFGRWSPRGATAAALLFGFAIALQNNLSINTHAIPSYLLAMLPYVATIIAVAGLVGKVRAPAADGEPYVKQ